MVVKYLTPDKTRQIQQLMQRSRSTAAAHVNRVEELSNLVMDLSNRIYELEEGEPGEVVAEVVTETVHGTGFYRVDEVAMPYGESVRMPTGLTVRRVDRVSRGEVVAQYVLAESDTSSDQEPGLNIPRLHNLKRRTVEEIRPGHHEYLFAEGVEVNVVDDPPGEETVIFSLTSPQDRIIVALPWQKARELMEWLDNRTTELEYPNDKPEEPSRGSWARQGFQDSMGSKRLVFPGDCPGGEDGEHEWSENRDGRPRSCRHCTAINPPLDKK